MVFPDINGWVGAGWHPGNAAGGNAEQQGGEQARQAQGPPPHRHRAEGHSQSELPGSPLDEILDEPEHPDRREKQADHAEDAHEGEHELARRNRRIDQPLKRHDRSKRQDPIGRRVASTSLQNRPLFGWHRPRGDLRPAVTAAEKCCPADLACHSVSVRSPGFA